MELRSSVPVLNAEAWTPRVDATRSRAEEHSEIDEEVLMQDSVLADILVVDWQALTTFVKANMVYKLLLTPGGLVRSDGHVATALRFLKFEKLAIFKVMTGPYQQPYKSWRCRCFVLAL